MTEAKTARREWGTGTLKDLGGGKYRLVANLGIDALTGKRRRKVEIFTGTKTAARDRLNDMIGKRAKGAPAQRSLQQLWDDYLNARELAGMSAFNRRQADNQFRRYVPEHLASTAIAKIEPSTVNDLYRHVIKTFGIEATTVRRFHNNLRACFGHAVTLRWLEENPVERATVPEANELELEPPTPEEVATFLAYVDKLPRDPGTKGEIRKASKLPDFVWLLIATGARPAELCGLQWADFDDDRKMLRIDESVSREAGAPTKATKTRRIRRVSLDDETVRVLKERRARYAEKALQVPNVSLDEWWVFPSRTKPEQPWRPDSASAAFAKAREAAGVSERVVMRNLRHDAASFLVGEGFDVLAVARRLGHSPQMLLNRYSHVFDDTATKAADAIGERMRGMRGR